MKTTPAQLAHALLSYPLGSVGIIAKTRLREIRDLLNEVTSHELSEQIMLWEESSAVYLVELKRSTSPCTLLYAFVTRFD